jgi:hypothetical protein
MTMSKEYNRKYREQNRSRIRAVQKAWRLAHPEIVRASQQKYSRANIEKIRTRNRQYVALRRGTPATINCLWCKRVHQPKQTGAKFCSKQCGNAHWRHENLDECRRKGREYAALHRRPSSRKFTTKTICPWCKKLFSRSITLQVYCSKRCSTEWRRHARPEARKEYSAHWRAKHLDRLRLASLKWYHDHRQQYRDYYLKHRCRILAKARSWRHEHPYNASSDLLKVIPEDVVLSLKDCAAMVRRARKEVV